MSYNKASCFDTSRTQGLHSHGRCGSQHGFSGTAIAPAPTSCTSTASLKGNRARLDGMDCDARACGRGVLWALTVCRKPSWSSGSSSRSQHWCMSCMCSRELLEWIWASAWNMSIAHCCYFWQQMSLLNPLMWEKKGPSNVKLEK